MESLIYWLDFFGFVLFLENMYLDFIANVNPHFNDNIHLFV